MRKFIIGAVLVMILDQLIKLVFLKYYPEVVVSNQGMAFGLIDSYSVWLIIILLAFLVIFAIKTQTPAKLGFGLVFGGGLSNFIDRIFRGGVVDFESTNLPAFNLADLAIIIGVLLVVLYMLKIDSKTGKRS